MELRTLPALKSRTCEETWQEARPVIGAAIRNVVSRWEANGDSLQWSDCPTWDGLPADPQASYGLMLKPEDSLRPVRAIFLISKPAGLEMGVSNPVTVRTLPIEGLTVETLADAIDATFEDVPLPRRLRARRA